MSVSIVAIPYALAFIVGLSGVSLSASISDQILNDKYVDEKVAFNNSLGNLDNIYDDTCDDVHVVKESNIINKTFETAFMDKDILIKTLVEHGFSNIQDDFGKVSGSYDKYFLMFEKPSQDKPYNLTITCLKNSKVDKIMNDLNDEYTLNVQEESYLSIIEKLKENSMNIEEEEVLEDNTIVLTINIE